MMFTVEQHGLEENASKRIKTNESSSNSKTDAVIKTSEIEQERCNICRQYINEVIFYNGHPNNAVEEFIALTDEKLMYYTNQDDDRPMHKITHFSVYDKNGHLCAFDGGLVENDKLLYFSGYIKPVYESNSTIDGGVSAKDLGPINEWYIGGFDGGKSGIVGFSTAFAEYYLMEASNEYEPLMKIARQKIILTKLVIEFLQEENWETLTYEDLLNRLQIHGNEIDEELSEEILLTHAQFVCDQVMSFDSAADPEEDVRPLITTPCMRALVKIAGVSFKSRRKICGLYNKVMKKKNTNKWSKATTTDLVYKVFENFFTEQLDGKIKDKGPRSKRCGVCEACQLPDCGKCNHCRDMLKFGGTGRSKQACRLRKCPNMAIEEAENSENEDENEQDEGEIKKIPTCSKRIIIHDSKWIGEEVETSGTKKYYRAAQIGEYVVEVGDYVMLNSEQPNSPLCIAKVAYLWEDNHKIAQFHAHLFCRGSDTVLGETSNPRELFVVDVCENCPLGCIVRKADVERRDIPKDWLMSGGLDNLPPWLEDNCKNFFYCKRYVAEHSRFEDLDDDVSCINSPFTYCQSCKRKYKQKQFNSPILKQDCITWRGEDYFIGSGVFLEPDTFKFRTELNMDVTFKTQSNIDDKMYPEYYRKTSDHVKGSNYETPAPFCIGLIEEIKDSTRDIKIVVRIFYRPENTVKGDMLGYKQNLNLLYWSDETLTISFAKVVGRCYIVHENNLEMPPSRWYEAGPYRFYFSEAYDNKNKTYTNVPISAIKIGQLSKGKDKIKSSKQKTYTETFPVWEVTKRPLQTMDVFAGCGGLSEGLHQAGIALTKWAVEKEHNAAQAFRINNADCIVYTEDCNDLLRLVLSGEATSKSLPKKGEVEMLIGGPPCQGFSGMNRFNAGQYSLFKNSLIVSYLSYCDYYRPRYFILENVRNFVSFKRSIILKLTLSCLLAIGYQVTFGILQAGHYGIPQTRRRLIIMAAAPGYVLPNYPEPQNVFHKRACQLTATIDNIRYSTGSRWINSAPYRSITVRDAVADLPDIKNGCNKKEMPYDEEATSHFQRIMRGKQQSDIVVDHICKEMSPLVEARMMRIPLYPGADWRDLPNVAVRLGDGTFINKLVYPYKKKKQKSNEVNRGVCSCAAGKGCDPANRQINTLIPWCLPHTADRHNHWTGLYGRLEWDGFFSTTITNPEPMGKQGRVLHPEQHRVVSVRECARSQGFPDCYKFHGTVLDKHRQIGNAVPPPLGLALGREIGKALALSPKLSYI